MSASNGRSLHTAVLPEVVASLLQVRENGSYIDATIGGAGHAELVLRRLGDTGRLLGIDRDSEALERVRETLKPWAGRVTLVHADFTEIERIANAHNVGEVDGIVFDLGISSDQLASADRGFSFSVDGPLDMRMDRSGGNTAANLVNGLDEKELERVFRQYGEERAARRIARALVAERTREPIRQTGRLAEIVARAKGGRRGRTHPATQAFQALRIAVNDELESAAKGIESALRILKPGGRIAVISFHSLEDRLVKNTFRAHVAKYESLEAGGQVRKVVQPEVTLVTPKPVVPSAEEMKLNPRSRSAKLRVAERVK